jgi:hypothetical protein
MNQVLMGREQASYLQNCVTFDTTSLYEKSVTCACVL